ncbi:hypothetical protein ACX0HA_17350 [Flavobacterium hauense]
MNYIVLEVLCRAKKPGMPNVFDSDSVIDKYKNLVSVNSKYITTPLNSAYQICKDLEVNDIKLLRKALHNNINIKGICEGNVKPILFSDIKIINKDLANYLYQFSKYLYTDVMKLKAFTDLFGELKDHYVEFSRLNEFKSKRCPYCGFARMLNEYNTKKEAYDHFFPKEQYPFISLHFMNLAPMCHTCNSAYKSRKNPIDIKRSGMQKKVFYPFYNYGKINLDVNLLNINIENIVPSEIEINNNLPGHSDEIESWEEIFSIKERYRSIYAGDCFTWFEEARIAFSDFGESYSNYKSHLDNNYYSNENFMKLAALQSFERIGLI